MTRSPSVNELSYRFKEMSIQRDRVLNGSERKSYGAAESHMYNGKMNTGNSRNKDDKIKSSYQSYQRSNNSSYNNTDNNSAAPISNNILFNSTTNTADNSPNWRNPNAYMSNKYEQDVLDDKDRLPSSYRRSHSATLNHSSSMNRINTVDRAPSCRWIKDENEEDQSAIRKNSTPHVSWGSFPPQNVQHNRPSPLLLSIITDVSQRRGVRTPPIPMEIIIAFETCVARGTFMLKFITHGAPHSRFFVIKFLNCTKSIKEAAAVLCWYASNKSWTMRRYFPLADLIAVINGGEQHPAVRRRMVGGEFIKAAYVDLKANYIPANDILQWHFRSSAGGEEIIAVKFMNREAYVAWRIVTDFISKIGAF